MHSLNNSCFICGYVVSQNDNHKDNDIAALHTSFDNNSSEIFRETDRKCILQIANYLKVPKSNFNKFGEEFVSKISICPPCLNISGKLSSLCEELEVIQMKIKYFLNLLTDQILTNDNSGIYQSNFQQTFHQKCLAELASSKVNPELRITKCETPKQPIKEEMFDNFDDDDVNDNFEDDLDSTSETFEDSSGPPGPIQLLEVLPHFKCKYCPMILSNRGNLESHMKAVHENTKSWNKRIIKTCEYCGAMINHKNLSTHKRNVHGIGRKLPADLGIRKMKRCEKCGKLLSIVNISGHRKLCGSKGKKVVKRNLGKDEDEEEVETYLVKKKFKCEKCNLWFGLKGSLLRHFSQNEMCRGFGGNMKQMKDERVISCPNNCGERFTFKSSLKRHLIRTCKMNKDGREDSNKVEIRIICGSKVEECGNIDDNKIKVEKSDV